MTTQFTLNTAATAMDNAERIMGEMIAIIAREGWAVNDVLTAAIDARRKLHAASDGARTAATLIHNERRRYQRLVGAESLREIA